MIQKVTAMTVRQNLGDILNGVQYQHNAVVITRAGKSVAALVDMELFEKIHTIKKLFEQMSQELAQSYQGEDEKSVAKDITEALTHIHKGK